MIKNVKIKIVLKNFCYEMNFEILNKRNFNKRNKGKNINFHIIYEGKFNFLKPEKYRNKGKVNFVEKYTKGVKMYEKEIKIKNFKNKLS